jgi:hypothetical protein
VVGQSHNPQQRRGRRRVAGRWLDNGAEIHLYSREAGRKLLRTASSRILASMLEFTANRLALVCVGFAFVLIVAVAVAFVVIASSSRRRHDKRDE